MADLNFPITTKLAGVTNYQQAIISYHRYHALRLIREPENGYDPNAIRVRANGKTVGYIPAHLAKDLAPMIDLGQIKMPKFVQKNISSKYATIGITIKIERN